MRELSVISKWKTIAEEEMMELMIKPPELLDQGQLGYVAGQKTAFSKVERLLKRKSKLSDSLSEDAYELWWKADLG